MECSQKVKGKSESTVKREVKPEITVAEEAKSEAKCEITVKAINELSCQGCGAHDESCIGDGATRKCQFRKELSECSAEMHSIEEEAGRQKGSKISVKLGGHNVTLEESCLSKQGGTTSQNEKSCGKKDSHKSLWILSHYRTH